MGSDSASDVDGAAEGSGCAPAARGEDRRTEEPGTENRVEKEGTRESWVEVVSGGGKQDEVGRNGDGLDWELAR